MPTPAQNRAVTKYAKTKLRRFTFSCHRVYDADIIVWLESLENFTEYLKTLIRDDLKKN